MSKRLIKLLPLAAALALSGYASASTPKNLPSVVVKYGDLNLDSEAGVKKLHARLRNAAERVCSPLDSRVLGLREQYERCVTDAITQSVTAVGNPSLIQFHRYGGRIGVVASR
jgi:hypothetical protein